VTRRAGGLWLAGWLTGDAMHRAGRRCGLLEQAGGAMGPALALDAIWG